MPSTRPNGQNKPAFAYLETSSLSDFPQNLCEGPTAMGWDMVSGTVKTALGISDNGIITGRVLFEGVTTGFVLIPIPEPSTYGLLGLGAVALVAHILRRRRRSA